MERSVMGCTGAGDCAAKCWLTGKRRSGGALLILLAQHSDAVLVAIRTMAGRLLEQRHFCAGCA